MSSLVLSSLMIELDQESKSWPTNTWTMLNESTQKSSRNGWLEGASSQWLGQHWLTSYVTLNSPPLLVRSRQSNVQQDQSQKTSISHPPILLHCSCTKILCTLLCVYCTMIHLLMLWCVCVWYLIKFCTHSLLFGFFLMENIFSHSQGFYSPWGFPLVCVGPPQT